MPSTTTKAQERAEAIERLREMLPPGSVVSTIARHVSRSGMSRSISLVINDEDISWLAARAMDDRIDRNNGGIKIAGAGMDMGFALVYNLSATLYPDGFECIGDGGPDAWLRLCPSNDHSNGDRDYTPHHHTSGGYAIRQRWL
jgi:hypothetical protein